jgi:hypothetical protein
MTDARMTQDEGASFGPGSREPSPSVSAASGFDPSRITQEFYLSRYYEPKAERPADNVQAAIEFTIDRFYVDLRELSPAEMVGVLATRILSAAQRAGLYVGIKIEPARDSDGSPKGGDACGSVEDDSAGPKDIAHNTIGDGQ